MLKQKLFNKKSNINIAFVFKMILVALFSWSTLYYVDIGSISQTIVSKIANESNEIESLKYLLRWFVVVFGGLLGTSIIYYILMDIMFIIVARFVRIVIYILFQQFMKTKNFRDNN